jgi:nucleotide sugar dehydrogenase
LCTGGFVPGSPPLRIAVIGLGKIGLPLAVQYAGKGHKVTGVDIAAEVVEQVNAGQEPFPGEAELDVRLKQVVADGSLTARVRFADAVPGADVVVVVVPLFVDADGRPDFGSMDAATADIAAVLTSGTTVIYETTLPVGTTRTRFTPALERGSGLVEGVDFWVAFSPERVLTGRVFTDLRRYPKLVGSLNDEGARRAAAFYSAVLDFDDRPDLDRPNGVWDLGSAEAAELAKLAETTYRDVNIGLANQFARFADGHGIDIHAVIGAANSQPYSHLHRPGIAVGGHCIPVYPHLYLVGDPSASVVRAARAANAAMPAYAVDLLAKALGGLAGVRVAVLGAAYRGGVKETAYSGVFPTVEALTAHGATAVVHDPLYTDTELDALGLAAYHLGERVDAAIVQTDHADYRTLGPEDLPGIRSIVDGRAVTDPDRWTAAGVVHRTLGVGVD